MKKILLAMACIYALNSCAPKYGCPSDGRNIGAEKLAAGDPKALKASQKAKFRGN
jgi:hypothetical protein